MLRHITMTIVLTIIMTINLNASDNLFSDTYDQWVTARMEQRMHMPSEKAYWYYQGLIDAYDEILQQLNPPSNEADDL